MIITNAFSINMLTDTTSVRFIKLSLPQAQDMVGSLVWTSAVGHADTAALFSRVLGVDVPCNRVTVEFDGTQPLLVGQYKGPRLPEGCSELPEGATIEWWYVKPVDWDAVEGFYSGRS